MIHVKKFGFGETEDYTANIGSLGVEDYEINNSENDHHT